MRPAVGVVAVAVVMASSLGVRGGWETVIPFRLPRPPRLAWILSLAEGAAMADEPSEEDRVTAWIERSAAGLRSAGDDRAAITAVFERFLNEGLAIVYSPSAMWDYV